MSDDFGLIFWVHIILIFLGLLTPFLLNFWLIAFGVLLIHLQWNLLGGCYLTQKQFCRDEEDKMTFYRYYLTKAGFPIDNKTSHLIAARILPSTVIFLAVFFQAFLQFEPLIF